MDVKVLAFRLSKIEDTLLMLSEEIHSMRKEIETWKLAEYR